MRRKTIFYVIYAGLMLGLLLLIGELVARSFGESPYKPYPYVIRSIEPEPYFLPDDSLGVRLTDGHFTLTFTNDFTFSATHNQAGRRTTRPLRMEKKYQGKPAIWIFGGSIAYGQSVSDSTNFPWLLQEAYPDYDIQNISGPGYSTIHALIQMENELKSGNLPEMVVLTYGAYQDKRNTFSRDFQKNLHSNSGAIRELNFPFAQLDDDDSLIVGFKPYTYRPWPGMRFSAGIHHLEKAYNRRLAHKANSQEVSKKLILRIKKLCQARNIPLVLYALRTDHQTEEMMGFFEAIDLPAKWISFDVKEPAFSLMPKDNHPNPFAHQKMAEELFELIERNRRNSAFTSWEMRRQQIDQDLSDLSSSLDSIRLLRQFSATLIDIGTEATNIDSLYPDWQKLSVPEFYDLFELDQASANCGAISYFLQQLYALYGFSSVRYNIGFPEKGLTHVTNLVQLSDQQKWIIEDATFNYSLTDQSGQPLDFFEMISKLKNGQHASIRKFSGREVSTEIIVPGTVKLDRFLEPFRECHSRIDSIVESRNAIRPHQLYSRRDLDMLFACNPTGNQYLDELEAKGLPRDFNFLLLWPNGPLDGPEAASLEPKLDRILRAE